MTHHEIEQQDIIERYVQHQLPTAERRAFQEHYFACDECFAQVESTAKFIAGIQRSARVGVLAESKVTRAAPWWASWFTPAFALAATACLLLAVALGWFAFRPTQPAREEASKPKPTPEQLAGEKAQPSPTTTAGPSLTPTVPEKSRRDELDDKLAQHQAPATPPLKGATVAVLLESTRDAKGGAQVKLPDNATTLTVRVEVEVGRYQSYQLQLFDASGRTVKTLTGLKANAQGTLTATIATQQLPVGKYLVKLFGLKNQQKDFVGEYDLTLRQ